MDANLTHDGVCQTNRILPFARVKIFAAFANADQLAQWWGPDGFSNTFDVFQFQPEGQWNFLMHGPDGQDYPNECKFLEVSPQKIVIRHVNAPHFTLTITLDELAGQTKLHWRQAFDDPKLAASIEHIIVPANEQNLNRLQKLLSSAMG